MVGRDRKPISSGGLGDNNNGNKRNAMLPNTWYRKYLPPFLNICPRNFRLFHFENKQMRRTVRF
ncbi:hypothetical protein SAMN05428988_0505 [Chitinophaga sp. YR573]|nr:hypothetical protein SAMN05428988_0505 [Chitinophaga sp. YR573]